MFLNEKSSTRDQKLTLLLMTVLIQLILVVASTSNQVPTTPITVTQLSDATYVHPRPQVEPRFPETMGPSEQRDSIVAFQARRWGMPVDLALAISHTENWRGDSLARSHVGAVGLMQVLPKVWSNSFLLECGFEDLTNRRRNACVGVMVAMGYFYQRGNWTDALRDYVGANCLPRYTIARCARLQEHAHDYVSTVMSKMYRTDLTPARDAAYHNTRGVPLASVRQPTRPID